MSLVRRAPRTRDDVFAMRRLTVGLALLAATLGASAATAAERGTIVGVVINETTGRRQAGVEVTLARQKSDGSERDATTVTTDGDGRYVFGDLPTGEAFLYVVDARYDGGLFPGRIVTLPDDTARPPVITSRVRVWNTTTDPSVIVIRRDDSFALTRGSEVEIVESVTVVNRAQKAYIGRGAALDEAGSSGATLGFALPSGARRETVSILDSGIDIPGILPTDFGFALTVAIPPGTTELAFRYRLSGAGGTFDLSRTALYPILEFSVFAEPPLEIRSNRLDPGDDVELEGQTYAKWSTSETLDPGDPLQVLAIAQARTKTLLIAGGIAVVAAILVALALATRRRRTRPRRREAMAQPIDARDGRHDLMVAIADLDLRYRSGELTADEWRLRRAALKRRLEPDTGVR